MRFCQSIPAVSCRVRYASQMAITEYGDALAYARMAPHAPISSDGQRVGAEPTSTWNPCFTSRIICMTFSRLPELSLMAITLGCSESATTASTGISTPVEAVVALSEHPNVIAIKESSGSLEKVMQMIREVKHGFQVLVGSAPTLWPSLLMGASGAILAYANAAPYSVIAIWEAYKTREEAAGLDWQNRIGRAAALVTSKYGVPGLKYAMDLNGYYGGPPRLPLSTPTEAAKREIEEAFRDLKG